MGTTVPFKIPERNVIRCKDQEKSRKIYFSGSEENEGKLQKYEHFLNVSCRILRFLQYGSDWLKRECMSWDILM